MTKSNKRGNDRYLTILVLTWVLAFLLLGTGFVFHSYTPIPAAAMIAGSVQTLAMIMLIIASIAGCIYIAHLMFRK